MRIHYIFLLLLPAICFAKKENCTDVKLGIYKSYELQGSINTIVRTNENHTETWGRNGLVVKYDILWTSDCTYILFNMEKIKGNDSLLTYSAQDTLYNKIIEINNVWQTIECSVNGKETKKEFKYFHVDTVQKYRNIEDFENMNNYKGAFGSGTLTGYNYFINCNQHKTDTNKYLLSFYEVLIFNQLTKYKLLDNVWCTIDTSQKITTSNCRYNDQYDKEITAVYSTIGKNKEAIIIMAWRFNRVRLKIESVPIFNVKYKESDKYLVN